MTVSTAWDSFEAYDHGHLSANARPQRLFGGVILACVALACAWILWVNSGNPGPNPGDPAADRISFLRPPPSLAVAAYAKLSVALKTYARRPAASNGLALLFDASHSLGFAPGR